MSIAILLFVVVHGISASHLATRAIAHDSLQVAMLQQDAKAAAGAPGAPAYESELRACALDLISGLAEGLGPSLDPLIANGPLIPLVAAAAGDDEPEVRQSGFALLGDLARACIGRVAPQYDDWVRLCLHNLEAPMLVQEAMSACNNACWSLGELSIKVGTIGGQHRAVFTGMGMTKGLLCSCMRMHNL